ncbi:MAG: hypothetical protein J6P28_07395 [Treponema sp.]|nr:hypothetical protein [Treponema sp.]
MKKNVLTFLLATAAALLLFLTPSCSGLATPSAPDAPEAQRYTLSGSFSMPYADAAPAEVTNATPSARNAVPDMSGLTYTVEAERSDGHTEITTSEDHSTYTFTNLTAGSWQITAYAKTSDGTSVMQSETETVTLSKSKPDANTSLVMEPASGRGEIALTVSWTNDSGIGYCEWAFSGSGSLSPSGTSTTSPITIRSSSVASGTHPLTLKFYTSSTNESNGAKPIYSCTEYVSVYPELTTRSWTSETAPHLEAGFRVTKECVETFVYRKIYVSQTGNDTSGNGTSERPFATIEKAMARLKEVASKGIRSGEISAATPWELHVSGTPTAPTSNISGNALIDVSSTIGNLAIIGEGSGATIDANQKGRVLYVASNTSVTIKSVTLTGGGVPSSIDRNTVYKGLCVYVATSGNLTMESGSSITGNTSPKATHGGGVYNEGTFTMNGGTISRNLARTTGRDRDQIGGDGGGVYNKGTFTMNDGTISTNKAMSGGSGVYNDSGTFTMNGGTISGNGVQEGSSIVFSGAGVMNRATFNMYDGTISGNESTYMGGGVYNVQGTFTMYGGTISGNSAATSESASANYGGGGVFAAGTVELLGGTITGNTVAAGINGSGVYVKSAQNDTFKMGGSAKVNSSNDVYLSGSSKIIISNPLTESAPVATITPATCTMNVTVLGGADELIKTNNTQFALSDSTYTINKNGNVWKDNLASLTLADMQTLIASEDAKTSADLIMQKTSGEDGSKQWRHMIGTEYVVKTTANRYCTLKITGISDNNVWVHTEVRLAGEETVRSWSFNGDNSDIDIALGVVESGGQNAKNDIHVNDGKPHNSAKFYIMKYVYNPSP